MAPLVKRVADPWTGANLFDDRMGIQCRSLGSLFLNKCCQLDWFNIKGFKFFFGIWLIILTIGSRYIFVTSC